MNLLVKCPDGTTIVVQFEADTTIAQIRAAVAAKLNEKAYGVEADQVRLVRGQATDLPDSVNGNTLTAGMAGLKNDHTLKVAIKVAVGPDPAVVPTLTKDLSGIGELKLTFVFLGMGSKDYNHGEKSIRRQQCPEKLPLICQNAGLQLLLIHVDTQFASEVDDSPQLYAIDTGWKLVVSEVSGKVRRYQHTDGHLMWVYGTPLARSEYELASLKPEQIGAGADAARTLVGLDLQLLAKAVAANGGAFVAGNFYTEDVAPYCVAGNKELLAQLGPPYFRGSTL